VVTLSLVFLCGTAQGGWTDITLTEPGFESGGSGWTGGSVFGAHATYAIPNHSGETLDSYFGGTFGTAYQIVGENFAADTTYLFTGLTGKYDDAGYMTFEIGYWDGAFQSLGSMDLYNTGCVNSHNESNDNSIYGGTCLTPSYGWNLRPGVSYSTQSSGAEIGNPVVVQFKKGNTQAWVDNFRLQKASGARETVASTGFQEATYGSDSYTPGGGATEIGFQSTNVHQVDAGHPAGYFEVRDNGAGNQYFELSNKEGDITFDAVDVSGHQNVMASVRLKMADAPPDGYEDGSNGRYNDIFKAYLELDNGTTTQDIELYDSYRGPDSQRNGSAGVHAGGDLDGQVFSGHLTGGIGLPTDQWTTLTAEIPDELDGQKVTGVRLKITTGNDANSTAEKFYIDWINFYGIPVTTTADLTVKKFFDCDLDNTKNGEDIDLSGWQFTVSNLAYGGTYNQVHTTDANGEINLTGLDKTQYDITETVKGTGWVLADANPRTIDLTGNTTVDFGNQLPGDANQDEKVNLADFTILKANFGVDPAGWTAGNFNTDTTVNLADFTILKASFGLGAPSAGGVPEPATMGLLALGAAALLKRRPRA